MRRKKNSLTSGKKMIEKKAFVYEAVYARVRVRLCATIAIFRLDRCERFLNINDEIKERLRRHT